MVYCLDLLSLIHYTSDAQSVHPFLQSCKYLAVVTTGDVYLPTD